MDVQLTQSLDCADDEYFERRQVVRAVAAVRRRLEDELGDRHNFLDPRAEMLVQLVRDLGLSTLEAVEALGSELVLNRLFMRCIPDLPFPDWHAWIDAHQGSTIATVPLPAGIQ